MALTIEGADVGYDKSGTDKLIADIKANVIEKAASEMKSNLNTLETSVDEIWVGHSADQFKQNMNTDVQNISDALNKTYEVLVSEINQIVSAMSQVDQELIKAR